MLSAEVLTQVHVLEASLVAVAVVAAAASHVQQQHAVSYCSVRGCVHSYSIS